MSKICLNTGASPLWNTIRQGPNSLVLFPLLAQVVSSQEGKQ